MHLGGVRSHHQKSGVDLVIQARSAVACLSSLRGISSLSIPTQTTKICVDFKFKCCAHHTVPFHGFSGILFFQYKISNTLPMQFLRRPPNIHGLSKMLANGFINQPIASANFVQLDGPFVSF